MPTRGVKPHPRDVLELRSLTPDCYAIFVQNLLLLMN